MKFHIETFGCQMNTADSEEIGRGLLARGFSRSASLNDADWVIVNTCTVRQQAENRALSYLGRLRRWKASDPRRRIVLAGCAAERLGGSIPGRFPQVDHVAGAKSVGRFSRLIDSWLSPENVAEDRSTASEWPPETDYASFFASASSTGFVTIMRGCNYSCSYCIVPSVRGTERYRPASSVLEEARQKASRGLSEIMLLGQTVNSYRPPPENGDGPAVTDFPDLLRAVDALPGVRRIRFMSPHPYYIDERLASAFRDCENLCPHIHLPVQSGSDRVLARMRRNYTRESYLRRLRLLRAAAPGLSVTTDFIVGFPGETEGDFRDTLSLVDEADFDSAYCFRYSPRPGTDSAALSDDVPEDEKERRLALLLEKIQSACAEKVKNMEGTEQEVLVDRVVGDGRSGEGRTRRFWKIGFESELPRRPGETVRVIVTSATNGSLKGHAAA